MDADRVGNLDQRTELKKESNSLAHVTRGREDDALGDDDLEPAVEEVQSRGFPGCPRRVRRNEPNRA